MFTGTLPDYTFFNGNVFTAVGGETTIPIQINPENVVIRNGVVLSPQFNYYRDPATSNIVLIDPNTAVAGDMFYVMNLSNFHVADTYTKTEMDSRLIPCGAIMAFAHGTPDAGWLECDGGLESQATWPTLFSKIGQNFRKVRTEIDSYLPLNGNGIDVSTYRDKTTIKGTSASYVTATGKFGATKVFQGSTTGGLLTRVGSSFNRSAWTIEGYWKAGSAAGTTRHIFMLGDAWAGLSGFSVSVWTDNKVYCYLNTNTALGTSTLTLSDQNLHHIAASYDGTTYRIFIDGVLYISVAAAAIPSTYNGNLALNWTYGADTTYQRASQYSHWLVTSGVTKYTSAFTPPTVAWDILETIPDGQFRKPDLRGESLRGWDHGRGVDSFGLRTIGSWQEDDFKNHEHLADIGILRNGAGGTAASVTTGGGSYVVSAVGDSVVENVGGLETRPRNVAVMFCIKAADMVSDPAVISASALDSRVSVLEDNITGVTFRNKIINGEMELAQRGTSFNSLQNNAYSLDRWKHTHVLYAGNVIVSRQTDAPTGGEFVYSLRATVGTAVAAPSATELYTINQAIEGYNMRDLVGKTTTLSFWVRSPKTGIHSVSIGSTDTTCIKEYTVIQANTWEKKSVTFPAIPSSGTWDYTTGLGLLVRFALMSGTDYKTSTIDTWRTSTQFASSNQVNCLDTIGNIFAITGVQLESGSVASSFEHRPFGIEQALCQRYYEKSYPIDTAPATNVGNDTTGWPGMLVWGSGVATASQYGMVHFKFSKRVSPTVLSYCGTGVAGKLNAGVGQVATTYGQPSITGIYFSSIIGAVWYGCHWTADAEI